MKKRTIYLILSIAVVLAALFLLQHFFYNDEDGWIKDSDGLWIEHGNPKTIPDEVKKQYDAIICGFVFHSKEKAKNISLDSQCLGKCGEYVIDLVNVPRTDSDDLPENQCPDFLTGNVTKLIEMDKNANVIRILD